MDESNVDIKKISKEFSFNVVTNSIELEEVMITIICLELSKDWLKTENFFGYFDKVSFNSKINLAETILKSNHPDILKKFPEVFEQVRKIKDLRNSLSHRSRYFEASVDDKEPKFVLYHRRNDKQNRFTKSEMNDQTKKIEKCLKDMWEVQNLFAKDFGYSSIV